MNLNLEIINPITYPNWDELISQTKNSTFFHTKAWAQVLFQSYGYTPVYFIQIENGQLHVALPLMEVKSLLTGKRGVALPFTDFCEPLIADDIDFKMVFHQLAIVGRQRGWQKISLSGCRNINDILPAASHFYGHELKLLHNPDELFRTFKSNIRRNVRKSQKQGVTVFFSHTFSALKEYYRLHCLTRKKHGLPPQPFYFFKNIFNVIISRHHGIIVLAKYNNNIIAGAIYFYLKDSVIYKYGASDFSFQKMRANNLIMWEAIKKFCLSGYTHFSFGKTEPHNKGLLQFKEGWDPEKYSYYNFKYNIKDENFKRNQRSKVFGFHNRVFEQTPIFLLKIIGRILYKHVC